MGVTTKVSQKTLSPWRKAINRSKPCREGWRWVVENNITTHRQLWEQCEYPGWMLWSFEATYGEARYLRLMEELFFKLPLWWVTRNYEDHDPDYARSLRALVTSSGRLRKKRRAAYVDSV